MTDLCRVFLVGNITHDLVRQRSDDGTLYGATTLCVGQTELVGGAPVTTIVPVPIEVRGASRVASADQFGAGSRVLMEGHLALRGAGLVVVVNAILNAGVPASTAEGSQQPTHHFWQDQT